MRKIMAITFIIFLTGLFITQISSAAIPQLIRYQGKLNDDQGIPLEGDYSLTFRIYDQDTGGVSLWTELQPAVQITQGVFNCLLGQVTELDLPFDTDYWLSIQVNDDAEMAPRQRITSVSYAFRAKVADTVETISTQSIEPQGDGSGLDADTVDGYDATALLDLSQHTGTISLDTIPQGSGSGLSSDYLDNQHGAFYLARSSHTGTQTPSTISPQGAGSGLDADTVDGFHASSLASANKLLALNSSAKLPVSITGDADTVDGFHASSSPQANKLIALDGSGKISPGVLKTYDSGWFAVSSPGEYTKTHNLGTTKVIWVTYFSPSSGGSPTYLAWSGFEGGYNQDSGSTLAAITTTTATLRCGVAGRTVMNVHTSLGAVTGYTSGYFRIIALALE